jgi:hypothetical protein
VSEQCPSRGLVQGRLQYSPQTCRGGPVLPAPTPHHSGTGEPRKGGPLWLRVPAYVQPVMLCQDQMRVSTTAVWVTTRTGFPPQVRPGMFMADDGQTAGGVDISGTSFEDSHHSPASVTAVQRLSTASGVRSSGSAVQTRSGWLATPAW